MTGSRIAKLLRPWLRGDEHQQRVAALRQRDGDNCRRCRRPMRFDLPSGHDKAPKIERIVPGLDDESATLDNLFLCHGRCNAQQDNTAEVLERAQLRQVSQSIAAE